MKAACSTMRSARSKFFTLMVMLGVGLGCSGSGAGCSGGCASLTPFPAGTRYTGPKSDHGISLRLSPSGVAYLNSNWSEVVNAFAPGGTIELPVPCSVTAIPTIGDFVIADQGGVGCTNESCGNNDGKCDSKDVDAKIKITVTGFALVPKAPDSIDATIQVSIDTDPLYVDTVKRNVSGCVGTSPVKCVIDFNTARSGTPDNRLRATVKFSIDNRFDKLLAFELSGLTGTQACSASGAPPKPECIDGDDLKIDDDNNCGKIYCNIADWDALKSFILGLISDPLQKQITDTLATIGCLPCTADAECPRTTDGSNSPSACDLDKKICKLGTACVPRLLGTEGKLNLGELLGSFGAPSNSEMELSIAAGAMVSVQETTNGGGSMSFGTRVGVQPAAVSSCVPTLAPPAVIPVTFPDFDGEAMPNSPFHVGLGLSSNFLNYAFWSAHQAGALCLNLTTDSIGLITTGLFKTFLQSLGKLATRDGKDAPMMIALRPARAPTVKLGEGTYDPATKKPIKPLLLVTLPDLSIDFYAMIDDRYARLFTLTADISLPLSLVFEGCDKVTPALGDIKTLISNIRTSNAEMLAEDPKVLAELVPAVIGLAEPAIAKALKPTTLPALGGFKLKVNEIKGLGRIAGTEAFDHLGVYAQMLPANGMCAYAAPQLMASLKDSYMPKAEEMRLTGTHALPWPRAELEVRTMGMAGTAEYSFKIDEGLWTDFVPATEGRLSVSHARFLMQGKHVIYVRARMADEPHGISSAKQVGFVVDWEAPEISLRADTAIDRLLVTARDVVSVNHLEYAYQLGEEAVSSFGPAREISLSAVEAQGGVTVFARDEFGNVGQAKYRPPQVALRPELAAQASNQEQTTGCSSTAAVELLALGALSLLRRRRQR